MNQREESRIYTLFEVSIILKGLHAAFEIVSGIVLAFVSSETIVRVVGAITQDELREDPHDAIANYLFQSAQHLAGGKGFAVWYLLSHGAVKVFLVGALLKKALWSYPVSIAVLGLFIAYQLYRYTFTHSIWLIALSVFDALIIVLAWHEYGVVRRALQSEEKTI